MTLTFFQGLLDSLINLECMAASSQKVLLIIFRLKVARYSFLGPIPPKFGHKLRRHKQSFGKIATTVVLDDFLKKLRFLRLTFLFYELLVSRLLIYCKAVK